MGMAHRPLASAKALAARRLAAGKSVSPKAEENIRVYSDVVKKSTGGRMVWTGKINLGGEDLLNKPRRWKRPRMIFVNSMSDLFHEDIPAAFILQVFRVMRECPWHTFQVLTKRPARMADLWVDICRGGDDGNPPRNVWMGVSAENAATFDERVFKLLALSPHPARRFLSAEPLLESFRLHEKRNTGHPTYSPCSATPRWKLLQDLDWVIVGGESGPGARQMPPDAAREIRDACDYLGWPSVARAQAAGWSIPENRPRLPFFFKQWGSVNERGEHVGKKTAGRLLDGMVYDGMPEAV